MKRQRKERPNSNKTKQPSQEKQQYNQALFIMEDMRSNAYRAVPSLNNGKSHPHRSFKEIPTLRFPNMLKTGPWDTAITLEDPRLRWRNGEQQVGCTWVITSWTWAGGPGGERGWKTDSAGPPHWATCVPSDLYCLVSSSRFQTGRAGFLKSTFPIHHSTRTLWYPWSLRPFPTDLLPRLALQGKRDTDERQRADPWWRGTDQQLSMRCPCGAVLNTARHACAHPEPPWLWVSVTNLIDHPEGRGRTCSWENCCQCLMSGCPNIPRSGRSDQSYETGKTIFSEYVTVILCFPS